MATHIAGEADGHSPSQPLVETEADHPARVTDWSPGPSCRVRYMSRPCWPTSGCWRRRGSRSAAAKNPTSTSALVSLLGIVMFALPILIVRTAAARRRTDQHARTNIVGTATGDLPLSAACLQVLLLPLALALAATAFGLTYCWVG